MFYKFIQKFITLRKREGRGRCQETLRSMHSIIDEMSIMYGNVPRKISPDYPDHPKGVIFVGSPEYKSFFENSWKPMIRDLLEQYKKSEFLTSFLDDFGSYYDSNIWFSSHSRRTLENFETLFSEITKMNDPLVNQLYETYGGLHYSRWYIRELREAGENYHAVENPFQNRNRSTSINGAVIRKVVIEDKDIKGTRYGDNIFKYILKILFVIINDVNYILTIRLFWYLDILYLQSHYFHLNIIF